MLNDDPGKGASSAKSKLTVIAWPAAQQRLARGRIAAAAVELDALLGQFMRNPVG